MDIMVRPALLVRRVRRILMSLVPPATYRRISKVDLKVPDSVSPEAKDVITRVRGSAAALSLRSLTELIATTA